METGFLTGFSQRNPRRPRVRENCGSTGFAGPGGGALVWATADSDEDDRRYYRAASQEFRLYPSTACRRVADEPIIRVDDVDRLTMTGGQVDKPSILSNLTPRSHGGRAVLSDGSAF